MKHLLAIMAIVITYLPLALSAQSVDELITRAVEARSVRSCSIPGPLVSTLIQRLSGGVSRQDQSKILSFLASQPNWRSADHSLALRVLNQISRQGDILTVSLVARALERADGELLDILTSGKRVEEIEEALRALIVNNEARNPVYANFAKLALAELLQERVFQQISQSTLPLSGETDAAPSLEMLSEAIRIYSEASDNFATLRTAEGFGARDYELDLPYLIALLKFIAGEESWVEDMRSIVAVEGRKDGYDTRTSGRHILVERFLAPPLLVGPTGDDRSDCKLRQTALQATQGFYARGEVRRFFNPVQLVNFTCNILNESTPFGGLASLVDKLDDFENRDYRVVLGHYRGTEVRFSFFSKAELIDIAESFATDVEVALPEIGTSQFSSSCSGGLAEPMRRNVTLVGVQETEKDAGYIYVGSGLSLDEAEQLQKVVVRNRDFRGAYLIRPSID